MLFSLCQNDSCSNILLFAFKLALLAPFDVNILLIFELKNEVGWANLKTNKSIIGLSSMSPSQRIHLMIFKCIKTDLSKVCGSFVMTFNLTNKNVRIKCLESEVTSRNHAHHHHHPNNTTPIPTILVSGLVTVQKLINNL